MTTTVVAQVVDKSGIAAWYWNGAFGGRYFDHAQAHPAASFADRQPGTCPISVGHQGEILGYVDYLEHGIEQCLDLRAVAVLDDVDPEEVDGLFCSAEITGEFRGDSLTAERCTLTGLAIVGETAGVAARPVRAFAGDFRNRYDRPTGRNVPNILERARKAVGTECRWSRPPALTIHRPTDVDLRIAAGLAPLEVQAQSLGRTETGQRPLLEMRSAPTLDVMERRRTIEVLAAPVDEEAAVVIGGKLVGERFGRACFAGDEHRVDRIKANRDHDHTRLVGKATKIDPYSVLGCVVELRASKTALGDETLVLAEDRVLDCSVGFRVKPNGEVWDAGRTRRQVTRGELDHVALVPDPAYVGAHVLAVRSTT